MTILISFRRSFSSKRHEISYNLLKVRRKSTPKEIREAYLKLIKIYHPDNVETGNNQRFLRVKEAYDRIKDAPLRDGQAHYRKTCDTEEVSYKPHLRQRESANIVIRTGDRLSVYQSVYSNQGLFRRFLELLFFSSRDKSVPSNDKTNIYEDKY